MLSSASGERVVGARHVRVGTLNPAKLRAVERAIARLGWQAEITGVDVESGVDEQPVGLAEIVSGARNRAAAALAAAAAPTDDDPASGDVLGVGIEDGLVVLDELGPREILNLGCAFVVGEQDGVRREGYGLSSGFAYPPACSREAVAERAPVGDLFDRWWTAQAGRAPLVAGRRSPEAASGRTVGNIGKLSLGALCRDEYAEHAVLCALIRFLHPDVYPDPELSAIRANPVRQEEPGAARAAAPE